MKVAALTFEQFHNKKDIGSTTIRVRNLMKYWPEYHFYKYGEKPDAMVFQKVYMLEDYTFMKNLDCIKILDICDPDWYQFEVQIKETLDAVDGITVPTQALADFLGQMTDKPIKVIKDRFIVAKIPPVRKLTEPTKNLVWFGYSHNAEILKSAIWGLEDKYTIDAMGKQIVSVKSPYKLTVISNDDPAEWRAATNPEAFEKKYTFKKYNQKTILRELNKYDAAILPDGSRPQDRFKSENKTILANLAGLPVIKTADDLRKLNDFEYRNKQAILKQELAVNDYDVRLSVKEMQEFINELSKNR